MKIQSVVTITGVGVISPAFEVCRQKRGLSWEQMKNGGGVAEEETMVFALKQGRKEGWESCWAGLALTVVLKPDPRPRLLLLGITPHAPRAEIDERPPDDRAESKGGARTLQHTGIPNRWGFTIKATHAVSIETV